MEPNKIADFHWQLTEYLGKTTVDAAAAGLQLLDWLAAMDETIVYTVTHGRIHLKSPRPFCTLHPQATHIACRVHDNGRAQTHKLTGLQDINDELHHHIWQAYQGVKE